MGGVMRAAVLAEPRRFELREAPIPTPGRAQVRVRLEGCGVCASGLPVWQGRPWFQYPLEPGALGHEGWGVIDAAGEDASDWKPGQRVACLSEHAYAEYDVADVGAMVRIPDEVEGPFPAEPLACAMNVMRRADIRAGQTVAVVGVGFLGALLIALSHRAGAKVIAISRRPWSLKLALQQGAVATAQLEDRDAAVRTVQRHTNKAGCERVIEAAGVQETLDVATELIAVNGRLVIAGYHQDGTRQVNLQKWNWNGIDVINAHERDPAKYVQGMRAAVDAVAGGSLDPTPLYTHVLPLERLNDAFEMLDRRPDGFVKALVGIEP